MFLFPSAVGLKDCLDLLGVDPVGIKDIEGKAEHGGITDLVSHGACGCPHLLQQSGLGLGKANSHSLKRWEWRRYWDRGRHGNRLGHCWHNRNGRFGGSLVGLNATVEQSVKLGAGSIGVLVLTMVGIHKVGVTSKPLMCIGRFYVRSSMQSCRISALSDGGSAVHPKRLALL